MEGVNRDMYVFIELGIVHNKSHTNAVSLRDKERRAHPFGGLLHLGNDVFVDKIVIH